MTHTHVKCHKTFVCRIIQEQVLRAPLYQSGSGGFRCCKKWISISFLACFLSFAYQEQAGKERRKQYGLIAHREKTDRQTDRQTDGRIEMWTMHRPHFDPSFQQLPFVLNCGIFCLHVNKRLSSRDGRKENELFRWRSSTILTHCYTHTDDHVLNC